MVVIGINSSGYVTSAAIVVNGDLVFGCAEERLDRRKFSRAFPIKSINECLAFTGLTLKDVDYFAVGYNPGISIAGRTRIGFSEWPAYPGARLFSNPNYLLPYFEDSDFTETAQIFKRSNGDATSIRYVTHHLAHASNAFLLSNFTEAAIATFDGYGERTTTLFGTAHVTNGISVNKTLDYPQSLGSLYATITQLLGFSPHQDEWKVMGASAYGDPRRYYQQLKKIFQWQDGQPDYELDLTFFNFFDFDVSPMFRPKLEHLLLPARQSSDPLKQEHFDLAAGIQKITEDYLLNSLTWLANDSKQKKLCISGGVAMNCVANGRLSLELPFDDVFVPYAPDDNGNSIGAALWVAWQESKLNVTSIDSRPYLGREFSDEEIEEVLKKYKLVYRKHPNIAEHVAQLVADGKVVGWFQGRMEFGHRALGARSIIADPRRRDMKDKINSAIKYRESFRPFAASILSSHFSEYFIGQGDLVPYMEKVYVVRPEKRDLVPAVVHHDFTCRPQTVEADVLPIFFDLIDHFYKKTNIPLVLNTSFNVNNEPIVADPSDAIRTYFSSGLDALAIGNFVLEKES